jgi:hypothetical protein
MEIVALQREIMLQEMLAERGRMILELNAKVMELQKQVEDLAPRVGVAPEPV